jgi:asparagine synthase (glutamine-hydrolysing)
VSGIVGILNLDGRPVDRDLLLRMCASLSYRGPDAQEIWSEGPIGFEHAMLQTAGESPGDRQPSSLDGHVWITADARVDGRGDLIRELQGKGRHAARSATDAELILHAYHAWGELCVQHLLGDFAFAIWDGRSRRLICVRDHFGVKPFYYAPTRGCLVFGNTLNCLRLHALHKHPLITPEWSASRSSARDEPQVRGLRIFAQADPRFVYSS